MAGNNIFIIDHLQGSLRGSRQVLSGQSIRVGTGQEAFIHFPAYSEPDVLTHHATLTRRDDHYRITATADSEVEVNGLTVVDKELVNGDLIRLGETGPLLRYRAISARTRKRGTRGPDGAPLYKSMKEVLDDCLDCARAESSSRIGSLWAFLRSLPKEISAQASPFVRVVFLTTLLVLLGLTGTIAVRVIRLEQQLSAQAERFTDTLGLFQQESEFTVDEMRRLREELSSTASRLSSLETQSGDVAGVVTLAAESVAFIQGSYAFQDENGNFLRTAVDAQGNPIRDFRGQALPTFSGDGPIFEKQYTGTAFVASEEGLFLTNHHVAEPWVFDAASQQAIQRGLTPVMVRMIGYLPSSREAFDVRLVEASSTADVAVLRCDNLDPDIRPIILSDTVPELGQSVMVLGYPTGIRALLARVDPAFVDSLLLINPNPGFWEMARELAVKGLIAPLVTRGIIGQVTSTAIVYDAETTHGGSGGPVIGLDGQVIAVNAAIVTDFGGSNLGVPAGSASALIARIASSERE